MAQKVGVDKYGVWGAKSGIVLEEETAGDLGAISNELSASSSQSAAEREEVNALTLLE
jgi:hypothetical protein